jgi:hypothetical protein
MISHAAKVDVGSVKFSKGRELGIDFSNQIDIWARMEFTFREQIKRLEVNPQRLAPGHKDLRTISYAFRESLE